MSEGPSAGLPREVAGDAQMLRAYPDLRGMNTATTQLAGWIATGANDTERAGRFEAVRTALGTDARGQEAFASLLFVGQAPAADPSRDGTLATRMRAAYGRAVADGAMSADDVRAGVRYEASVGRGLDPAEAIGVPHPGLTVFDSRLSSYVESLGRDPRGEAARDAFVSESLARAHDLRASSPAASAALYAQAANAMRDMPAERIESHLARIGGDGQGIAQFAAGAAAGVAERAKPVDFPTPNGHVEMRADGLARVMKTLDGAVSDARNGGRSDAIAQTQSAQLFTGVAALLTAARGTELDRRLSEFDDRTGLREAMTGAMSANFPTIFRHNARDHGEGLVAPGGGFDTFSSYARFAFGAPNDAHGRATAADAERVLGDTLGTLHGDILKAGRDGGADLRRDFGNGTFGDRAHEQQNAARVLGELAGATRNGINQDFDMRADRATADQKERSETFERAATIVGYAAKVAGERAGPVLDAAKEGLEALAKAVPAQVTDPSGRGVTFGELERRFGSDLARFRPNADLANRFDDGRSVATTEWANYDTQRNEAKTRDGALASQKGLLPSLLMKTIVPAPDAPAASLAPAAPSPAERQHATARSVAAYNEDHPTGRLAVPLAGNVAPWDGKARTGIVLAIGPGEYAIHCGRGTYETFSTAQTRGVEPPVNAPIELHRDGTVQALQPSAHGQAR